MNTNRRADLFEIVYSGRNQAYGGYVLRKKYNKYLLISTILSILLFTGFTVGPVLYYYFEPLPLIDSDRITDVQYYSMLPPPDEAQNKLAGSIPKPPEAEQEPLVVDSVTAEKLKPVEDMPPVEEDVNQTDTAGKGQGNAVSGHGEGDATGIVTMIDVYPRYPGGDDARLWFLRKNVHYPETALKAGVQGVVVVVFIIEIDGSLSNIEVTKGIGGGCDEEAIRVVKLMPRWEPARRNSRSVRVVVRMPIVFRMPGK